MTTPTAPSAQDTEFDVVDRILGWCREHPEAIAVRDQHGEMSYGELLTQAGSVAQLLSTGSAAGRNVMVDVGRAKERVVALLAVLMSKACYVPVDANWPEARKKQVRSSARAAVEIALASGVGGCATGSPSVVGNLSISHVDVGDDSPGVPGYMIYTSGSTGEPKGVVVPTDSLNYVLAYSIHRFKVSREMRLLAVASPAFDFSVFELLLPLVGGGTVCVAPELAPRDPQLFRELTEKWAVTCLTGTPTMFTLLTTGGWAPMAAQSIIAGGERFDDALADKLGRARDIWNIYGPTEITIFCTSQHVRSGEPVNLGHVLPGTVIVLDTRNAEEWGEGVGEIVVHGPGVGLGYHNRRDLTDSRFGVGEMDGAPVRFYRTGDLGRWNADGTLTFIGRMDHQVKVNGNRIELEEVEAALASVLRGTGCCVVLQSRGARTKLVAFVDASAESGVSTTESALRRTLCAILPAYAVPTSFRYLDGLPVTTNGKVDRQRLTAMANADAESVAASDRVDQDSATMDSPCRDILHAFCAVLDHQVDLSDDFFATGGDSLAALEAVILLQEAGIDIEVQDLYMYPSVEKLAQVVGSRSSRAIGHQQPVVRTDNRDVPFSASDDEGDLLPSHWRYLERGAAAPRNFVEAITVPVEQGLLLEDVESIASRMELRFPELTTLLQVAPEAPGGYRLRRAPGVIRARSIDIDETWDSAAPLVRAEVCEMGLSLDVTEGPLAFLLLVNCADRAHVIFVVHHWVCDGISLREYTRWLLAAPREQHDSGVEAGPCSSLAYASALRTFRASNAAGAGLARLAAVRWRDEMPNESAGVLTATLGRVLAPEVVDSPAILSLSSARTNTYGLVERTMLAAVSHACLTTFGAARLVVDVTRNGRDAQGLPLGGGYRGWISSTVPVQVNLRNSDTLGGVLSDVSESFDDMLAYETAWAAFRYTSRDSWVCNGLRQVSPSVFLNVTAGAVADWDSPQDSSRLLEDYRGKTYPYAYGYPLEVRARISGSQLRLTLSYNASLVSRVLAESLRERICADFVALCPSLVMAGSEE